MYARRGRPGRIDLVDEDCDGMTAVRRELVSSFDAASAVAMDGSLLRSTNGAVDWLTIQNGSYTWAPLNDLALSFQDTEAHGGVSFGQDWVTANGGVDEWEDGGALGVGDAYSEDGSDLLVLTGLDVGRACESAAYVATHVLGADQLEFKVEDLLAHPHAADVYFAVVSEGWGSLLVSGDDLEHRQAGSLAYGTRDDGSGEVGDIFLGAVSVVDGEITW